jgi:hypothetical protein
MGVQFAGNILVQSNGGPLPISMGGTGQTTSTTALNVLLPVQTGQSGKVLTTDGTNTSWSASAGGAPGGADTNIQFNDSGVFGGNANLLVNKATGALTSASTLKGTGNLISGANQTVRAIKYQTAGSDRWLMQTNNTDESGSNLGSNFEFVRVADNGLTQNQIFTIERNASVVDFKATPTVNGVAIGTGSGTVTSVAVSGGTTGLTTSGGPVTGSGTITLAGTLAAVNGGTGASVYTVGDILYASSSSALSKLAASTSGYVLTANGAGNAPSWQAVSVPTAAAGTLTGTTLATGVVTSSLTSVGTLTGVNTSGSLASLGVTTVSAYLGAGAAGTYPQTTFIVGNRPADNRVSQVIADRDSGSLTIRFLNDAGNVAGNILNASRSGATVGTTTLSGTAINLEVGTGALQLNGNAGTSGQVLTSNGTSLAPTWQVASAGAAAAGALTGTTLAANVVSSSLTSVGTLGTLAVTGNITAADPTTATQVTTKQYVDNLLNGILWKTAVDTATTADITLSGSQTVDGVAIGLGNRILVKNQSTATENGVYIGAVGAWARATDWDSPSEVNGAAVFVKNGTTQADTAWVQTADITTVGTQAMTFTQFSNSGAAAAGSLTGTTLAANVTTSSLTSVGTLTSVSTSGDIQQNNATYLKGKLAAGTATRLFGLSAANTLYIGSVDADHTGSTLFVKNGITQMAIDANSNVGIGLVPVQRLTVYTGGATASYGQFTNGATGPTASNGLLVGSDAAGSGVFNVQGTFPAIISTSGTERIRVTSAGGVSFGASGTAFGTAGQVLTSNGNAPPTWTTSAVNLPRVTSISSTVVGKRVAVSTSQTVTATTWSGGGSIAVGDIFSIYNDSSSAITVSAGPGLTMYKDGTASAVGSVTLAARGSCTVWYNTVSEVILNGSIV